VPRHPPERRFSPRCDFSLTNGFKKKKRARDRVRPRRLRFGHTVSPALKIARRTPYRVQRGARQGPCVGMRMPKAFPDRETGPRNVIARFEEE
jgi:hypothetical protein